MGTPDVWKDFSNQGLFVFDWKLYDGPYLKVQEPTGRIPDDLRFKILAVRAYLESTWVSKRKQE
jgi:hypothetical protein